MHINTVYIQRDNFNVGTRALWFYYIPSVTLYMKCTHISDRQIDNGHLDEKKTYSMAKRYNKRKIVPLTYGEQRRF